MPAATPLPGTPTVVTLYTAADLLTGPGCPVCRYAGEVSDRYFAWFALEAHAQSSTLTRLSRALGMCPRHTRRLMSQPGAAARLTVVYRHVVKAARVQLAGRITRLARCPACEHDDRAAHTALDTLLEGLTDGPDRERYRELGGLCIPHLRTAIAQAERGLAVWLTGTSMAALDGPMPGPGRLAGTDHDAEARTVLRKAIASATRLGADVCVACLAAGRAEAEHLARALHEERHRQDHRLLVCGGHLGDLAVLSGRDGIPALLASQAVRLTTATIKHPALRAPGKAGNARRWPRLPHRSSAAPIGCPVCTGAGDAAAQELEDLRELLRARAPEPHWRAPLCVRHLLRLRAFDPWAGRITARGALERADALIDELNEAFSKNVQAHRHEMRAREISAWRRAAAFVDGGVFCGCPPP